MPIGGLLPLTERGRNIIIKIMKPQKRPKRVTHAETISTHDMRFKFDRVLRAMKEGRSLTLTYRNHALARIVPLQSDAAPDPNDSIFQLHKFAEPIGPLTNAQIDAEIYGS
jgi:antitoxin (DNA-binding transcriptional repressor) of toxin-antitoxin stability system